MKQLIGNKIVRIRVGTIEDEDDDSQLNTLVFDTLYGEKENRLIYITGGDCCSETWWADILGVENLLEAVVTDVQPIEEIDLDEDDERNKRSRQNIDIIYGYTIKTDKGDASIFYRNSSNGYYGGYDYFYLGDLPEIFEDEIDIKEDWQGC